MVCPAPLLGAEVFICYLLSVSSSLIFGVSALLHALEGPQATSLLSIVCSMWSFPVPNDGQRPTPL